MRSFLPLALLCALLLPATSTGQGDEASKPPADILGDAARDLGAVHSYHVAGTRSGSDGSMRIAGDVDASGPMRLRLDLGRQKLALIVTRSAAYVRASRNFWRRQGHIKSAKQLKLLSNRWSRFPADLGLADLGRQFTPATLAHCLTTNLGTVTKRPTTTFEGRRVIVLEDKGDKPGTSPGLLYVKAAGQILPVRAVQTGRQRPGGHPEAGCGGAGPPRRCGAARPGRRRPRTSVSAASTSR